MALKEAIDLKPSDWTADKWIGLDDYPLFGTTPADVAAHREVLNQKIIREYWNSEIGMETISLFSFAVRRKMHKEMPMMNLLYESAELEFDALVTTDMRTTSTSEGETEGTSKSINTNTSESKSTNLVVNSDFPQSFLSDRGNYATSATDGDGTAAVKADAEANDESAGKTTNTDEGTVKGFQGNAAELILAKRATFINIDARVVDMLAECFMQVWADSAQHLYNGGRY